MRIFIIFLFVVSPVFGNAKAAQAGVPNYQKATLAEHTYYISNLGDDNNNGLSMAKPFRTVAKAIRQAGPGDTVYLRGGIYRQTISLGADSSAQFNTGATASSRITFKSYPSERAIITSMQLRDKPEYWQQVPGYKNVFMTAITLTRLSGTYKPERVPNCSQDGVPLMLMTDTYSNGDPNLLKGPGQWVRDTRALKIYVWSRDGQNPGLSKTEISEFPRGGTATIALYCEHSRASKKTQPDYITFEDLTIEGGYCSLSVETNNIVVRNCTVRNCYGDAIQVGGAKPKDTNNPDAPNDMGYYNSLNGLIEGCDIYNFGEQGIDITGGDYWVIRDNQIHDNASNRGDLPGGTKGAGIILKNNCIGATVENNKIYDINSSYGAITIGGSSWGNIADEAVDCIVCENQIYRITGPYAVLFMAADKCVFRNNLVRDCSLSETVIRFACGNTTKLNYKNRDCSILNNSFLNNNVSQHFMYYSPTDSVVNLTSDYSTISPKMNYYWNGNGLTFDGFRSLGYEANLK
jgi:hypothetical protein